jgi:outer membrane protein, heavy metal efflux system
VRKHIILALMFSCFLATTLLADDNITFNEILNRVHNNNFELKAMQQQIEAAKSGIIQARFIPNPELEIELGNFGIDEIGVGIGQSFELGGKKKTRIEIAELDLKRSELAFELKKFELEITAFRKVLPLLSISGKLALLDSLITIERSTLETIQKRVEAGTTMPIDALRAEIDMEELFLEKRSANNEIAQLIQNLPILWSDSTVDFTSVAGVINHEITIPSIEIFQTSLLNHPEIEMLDLDRKLSKLELDETKSNSIPDLTIGVGVTRSMETEENTFGLSAGIELPIFNRNQGQIKGKKYLVTANKFETDNTILTKQAELQVLYNQLSIVNEELVTIETKILPKAETVFQTLLGYYKQGSVSLLDVIEAQTEFLEYKTTVIESHTERAELLTDLYELTGLKTEFIINQ